MCTGQGIEHGVDGQTVYTDNLSATPEKSLPFQLCPFSLYDCIPFLLSHYRKITWKMANGPPAVSESNNRCTCMMTANLFFDMVIRHICSAIAEKLLGKWPVATCHV